jgi:ubiquinone/menaquinone biosynthesis C-methylase UbiE
MISKHRDAYSYLPASVLEFPEPSALALRMQLAGFHEVAYASLLGGVCAIHQGVRELGSKGADRPSSPAP